MARKIGKYLEVDGGLFAEDGGERAFKDALAKGIKEQGEKAKEIMVGFIAATPFVDSGDYISSVEATFKRSGPSVVGFALIETTDDWQNRGKGRPTDTWLARGERGGKKLRKGSDVFTKTSNRVKDNSYTEIEHAIVRALD